jgi:AcrR family transcriptional regulator
VGSGAVDPAARDRIVSTAERLFAAHGYAGVTVARIAAGAKVPVRVLTRHFPAKPALFFADRPPVDAGLLPAVRDRPAGQSAYEALRGHAARTPRDVTALARAVRDRPPGDSVLAAIEAFTGPAAARARAFLDSEELQGYARRAFARLEEELAVVLAADTGAETDDALPPVAAAALVAPLRTGYVAEQHRLAAGLPPVEVAHRRAADLAGAYALLGPALADYARR